MCGCSSLIVRYGLRRHRALSEVGGRDRCSRPHADLARAPRGRPAPLRVRVGPQARLSRGCPAEPAAARTAKPRPVARSLLARGSPETGRAGPPSPGGPAPEHTLEQLTMSSAVPPVVDPGTAVLGGRAGERSMTVRGRIARVLADVDQLPVDLSRPTSAGPIERPPARPPARRADRASSGLAPVAAPPSPARRQPAIGDDEVVADLRVLEPARLLVWPRRAAEEPSPVRGARGDSWARRRG